MRKAQVPALGETGSSLVLGPSSLSLLEALPYLSFCSFSFINPSFPSIPIFFLEDFQKFKSCSHSFEQALIRFPPTLALSSFHDSSRSYLYLYLIALTDGIMFKSVKNYIKPEKDVPSKGNDVLPMCRTPVPRSHPTSAHTSRPPTGGYGRASGATSFSDMGLMSATVNLMRMAQIQQRYMWCVPQPPPGEGAVYKVKPGEFITQPESLKQNNDPFFEAAVELNSRVSSWPKLGQ